MQPQELHHQTHHRWLLPNQSGQKVSKETHFYDDYLDGGKFFCSLHLHSTSSVELIKTGVGELEFVLLQHWSSNPPESVSREVARSIYGDKMPEHYGLLENVV
jgi:hypothetical protein